MMIVEDEATSNTVHFFLNVHIANVLSRHWWVAENNTTKSFSSATRDESSRDSVQLLFCPSSLFSRTQSQMKRKNVPLSS